MSVKIKLLAVVSFFCLVCGLVSAQSYQIRTDNVINLRASFSLNADIVETVGAGTVLDVVGKFNRWYRISRNGAEVWMADWVNHSRLDSGTPVATDYAAPQPITSAETEIDNCCFVDRQCTTDEEWVSGYNAFQNQQCGMPAQAPMQTVTAPVSQPTVIDNLCYTVRTCTTPLEWVDGYHAYQAQQNQDSQPQVETQTEQTQTSSQVTYVQNCSHARSLGLYNIPRGHPAYRRALDRDNDGIGCER